MSKLFQKLCVFSLFLSFALLPATAFAKDYPTKPINMVIAFTAGGSSDVQARIMQKYWDKYADQRWTFVYKPGAGGAIGFGDIAMAKPDGYTIGGINVPHLIIQSHVLKSQFAVDDFTYICQVVNDPQAIVVRKDSPINSAKEFFDYVKDNPGKLKLGLVGPNSGHHMMFMDIQSKFDFKVVDVFYKGAADQNAAILGGEVHAMFGNLNDIMRSIDELKVLAIAGTERNDFLPDVPTLREEGFDVVSDIRRAFAAPKNLGQKEKEYLTGIFKKICEDPDYLADMKLAGQPAEYMDGEAFTKYVTEQNTLVEKYLIDSGIIKK